jgi:hypothetical protein
MSKIFIIEENEKVSGNLKFFVLIFKGFQNFKNLVQFLTVFKISKINFY